jgi:hypothetical protein
VAGLGWSAGPYGNASREKVVFRFFLVFLFIFFYQPRPPASVLPQRE